MSAYRPSGLAEQVAMNQTPHSELRSSKRLDVSSTVLPFIGSRESDHQPFQYLLQDISAGGVKIAIPAWLASREHLPRGERVAFHLPFLMGGAVMDEGVVSWERWDQEQESQLVGLSLDRVAAPAYPILLTVSQDGLALDLAGLDLPGGMLAAVLKDCMLLKRGILIYLKHMAAFFSRVSDLSREDYAEFRALVLDEVRDRVASNASWFEALLGRLDQDGGIRDEQVQELDLEELRQVAEPEIYADLLAQALQSDVVRRYLDAIKLLERKVYANYNALTMLYLRYL
jgi:hypothetical protein